MGVVGVVYADGKGGSIWGCMTVGVGALASRVGCSLWDGVVGLLVGSDSLWQVLPVVAALGSGVELAIDVGLAVKGRLFVMVRRESSLCTGR